MGLLADLTRRVAHRGVRRAALALAGLWLVSTLSYALDPESEITQYAHKAWNPENGSPTVRALTQTDDGILWLGTDSGLQRFDGVRFERWTPATRPELAAEPVNALAQGRDRSLWIGAREGLIHWKDQQVQYFRVAKGAGGPRVSAILADRQGNVWVAEIGHESGALCRADAGGPHCPAADAAVGVGVQSLFEDRMGSLWLGQLTLCKWGPGCPNVYRLPAGGEVHAIGQSPDGEVWAGGEGLYQVTNGGLVAYPLPGVARGLHVRALLTDRDGGIWIGTLGQGLFRLYRGRVARYTSKDGLSNDKVHCLLEDAEGNIWAGTDGGVDRFHEYPVLTLSKGDGGLESAANSIFASRDGGVWIGTAAGLRHLRDGKTIAYGERQGLYPGEVLGMFEERSGRLWVSTKAGLAYKDGDRFHLLNLPSGDRIFVAAAVEDRGHTVWISDPKHGLIQLRDARVTGMVPWSRFDNRYALALETDPGNGDLWLGLNQGGIACYRADQVIRYATPGPRDRGAVMDLHMASDGSLWIASQSGLSRFSRGRVIPLTANGLPAESIRAIVEDNGGSLWLDMAFGLARISRADLARWSADPAAKIHPRIFNAADGMRMGQNATGYFRRAARSRDGRLWFAVFDGVAVVDPNRLRENRRPPPVRIEGIFAGKTAYSIAPGLRLPPNPKELRIDFTAMSFVMPDRVQFRYRLDGFDSDWHEATTTRQAVYTNLSPRDYRFRVIAANNDGVWNETGAWCDFRIQPAFYQRTSSRLAGLAALALALWGWHLLRVRRVRARITAIFDAQLAERQAERSRIAREMHDTMLQTLTGCSLQLQGLAKAAIPDAIRERLSEICADAETCARQAREFVWDLRAPTLEEADLSRTLREEGERILAGRPVRFRVTVKGTPHSAPADLQQNLLRIVQEALRNAARYSSAREIGMQIDYLEPDVIRVQMRDDGCGFDPENASRETGHWGLITMRERARQMGAELKISSAPGQGTEIEILVPCPAT